jgi:hypothetical protein
MTQLQPYFVQNSVERLYPRLTEGYRRLLRELVACLDEDGRARVADVHQALFPAATAVASANAQLNRLQTTVNQVASEQGIALTIRITTDKKAGAQGRWLWFEGGVEAPAPAYTGELTAVAAGKSA